MGNIVPNKKIQNIISWGTLFGSITISMVILLFVKPVPNVVRLLISAILLAGLLIQLYAYLHWDMGIWSARFMMALVCIMGAVLDSFALWIPQTLLLCAFIVIYTEPVRQRDFFSAALSGAVAFEACSILNLCEIMAVRGMMRTMLSSYALDIVFVLLFLMVVFYENEGRIPKRYFKIAGIAASAASVIAILIFFAGAAGTAEKVDARGTEDIKKGDWIMLAKEGNQQIVLCNENSYLIENDFEYSKENVFHLVRADGEERWYIKDFMGRAFDIQEEEIAADENVRLLNSKKEALSWKIIDVAGMGTVFEAAENMYLNVEKERAAYLFPWNGAGNNLFRVKVFRSRLEHIRYFLCIWSNKKELAIILLCAVAAIACGVFGSLYQRRKKGYMEREKI